MDKNDLSLFSKKELWKMAHDARGNSYLLKTIPKVKRRKIMDDNMHLMEGMPFSKGYPVLRPYNGPTDFSLVSFSDRNRGSFENTAVHFFIDDYRFRDAIWYNLEHSAYSISKFDYVFTPDFSLWRNLKTEYYNQKNLYRTRFVGAYLTLCGFNVIPTASWGGLESFSYCFTGLPEESIIAVSAMGARADQQSFDLWCYGIERLIIEKSPTLLLIYGEEFEVSGINVPIKFLPTFISNHFRHGKARK